MHEYRTEHKVLGYIRELLSKEQRKYLFSGAHYLILDKGAFYEYWKQKLTSQNDTLDRSSNKTSFIIHGMSHGDVLVEFSQSNQESATLLCIKPHLPPQPHFIKSWVFILLESIFGISFGPKGFCRYTKERPLIIHPRSNASTKNLKHNITLSSQSSFLPSYHQSNKKLKNHRDATDHLNFNQFPKNNHNSPKF